MDESGAPSYRRASIDIVLAGVAWGTGGVVAALLHDTAGLGPFAVSFWRFFGGALLLALVRCRGGRWPRFDGRAVITGIGMAAYQTAYFAAINLTGVAVATLVAIGLSPVCAALGGRWLLGERLGRRGAVTVAVALGGLGLLVLGGSGDTHPVSPAGLAVGALAAFGYAGVTLFNRAGAAQGGDPLPGLAVGAVCLFPVALLTGFDPGGEPLTWGLLGYLGTVPSALAFGCFLRGLRVVPAAPAAVLTLVEPVVAAVLGVCVLHERLSAPMVAGGVLLLASTVLTARRPVTDTVH